MSLILRRLSWAVPLGAAPAVVGGTTFSPPDVFSTVAYIGAALPLTLLLGYHVASKENPKEGRRPNRLWLFAGCLLALLLVAGAAFSRLDPTMLWELRQEYQLGAVAGSVGGLFLVAEVVIYYGVFDRLHGLFS
ncbi:hypothetical protein [Haloarchaeobius sp. HME9146]|uniref:hypothetical protein n=1 Tax=Haloarchaeobius sp. HME9146 TaxID=2978732 RepID=UPI0021BEC773|nr:hypothetical protein [Haloarchaeobius sp. HME9146]MCT9095423.1 hypothetical protein [Haloarchaeobius sp. HME9146]